MKATRTLDVLAIAGGVLALLMIALVVYQELPGPSTNYDTARLSLLRRLPDSPAKADLELSTAFCEQIFPKAYQRRSETLQRVAREFPNSANVQFRAGLYGEGKQSLDALRRVARLDQSNAMPLYLLAHNAASQKSWNEAFLLLKQGNARKDYTQYPLEMESLQTSNCQEQSVLMIAATDYSAYARLRDMARKFSEHSADLHSTGRTDEALAILAEAKRAGWTVIHGKHGETMDVLVGVAMVKIPLKHEEDIYKSVDSRDGLARVAREKRKLLYLQAGTRILTDQIMPHLLDNMGAFYAPMVTIAPLALEVCFALVAIVIFAVLALRTKREVASELHSRVTTRTFPLGRLLKLYALVFLPIGIAAAIVLYATFDASEPLSMFVAMAVAVLLPSILLHWCASARYKRAYGDEIPAEGADCPRLWKGVTIQEKREVSRRLAGVHGGAVVFLVVLGLLISIGIKLTFGAFPWQSSLQMENWRFPERKFVADLVAGKVKVPESDIRKLEHK